MKDTTPGSGVRATKVLRNPRNTNDVGSVLFCPCSQTYNGKLIDKANGNDYSEQLNTDGPSKNSPIEMFWGQCSLRGEGSNSGPIQSGGRWQVGFVL